MDREEIEQGVRQILSARAKLPLDVVGLGSRDSLYDAGMTSHATVKVMLSLEDRFDIEFPDELLDRSNFDEISTIVGIVEKLLGLD